MKQNIIFIFILFGVLTSCKQSPKTVYNEARNLSSSIDTEKRFNHQAHLLTIEGDLKRSSGDLQGAIEDYTKAIEICPEYDTAYFLRGIVKEDIGDMQGALADYNKALEFNPQYAKVYYNRALLKTGEEAIKDYSKAIKSNPNYVSAYNNRGYVYSELGKEDEALKDYEKALEVAPKPLQAEAADMLSNIGRIYYDREDFKRALEYYNQAIEVAPNDGDLYYNRGLAKKRLNDKDGACDDWKIAQSLGISMANVVLKICDE